MHELMRGERVVGGDIVFTGHHRIEHIGLIFRKIRPTKLRAAFLRTELVDAGRYRDPRNPVRERHRALILLKPGKHFQKNILRKVFLGDATREMGTHDADNQRVKMIDQLTRGGLITLTHAHQAASHVERRFFIRHRDRKLKPNTARKTGFTAAGYMRPKAIP